MPKMSLKSHRNFIPFIQIVVGKSYTVNNWSCYNFLRTSGDNYFDVGVKGTQIKVIKKIESPWDWC
jgi:hypothetical protein